MSAYRIKRNQLVFCRGYARDHMQSDDLDPVSSCRRRAELLRSASGESMEGQHTLVHKHENVSRVIPI